MPTVLIVFVVGALLVIAFIQGWEAGHPHPRRPHSLSRQQSGPDERRIPNLLESM